MILSGVLPTINYFNNFGVPLLGDALTYPFGVQTLAYYFLDPHLAMTVVRGLVAFCTTTVFYLFFKLFLNTPTSLLCALLSILTPIAFWYPVHQYQLASVFGFSLFLFSHQFFKGPRFKIILVLTLLWALMVLSVSINHVILFIPFWLAWCLIKSNFKINRKFFATQIAMICGLVLTSVQTYDFFVNFASSARVHEGVYDSVLTNWRELFLGMVIPPGEWLSYNYGAQLQVSTYIALPIIVLVMFGTFYTAKYSRQRHFWPIILCGVVPTLSALILYISPEIRLRTPLVKSGDITRVLWFSMPFCMIAVGFFWESLQRNVVGVRVIVLMLMATLIGIASFWLAPEFENLTVFHISAALVFFCALFLMLLGKVADGSRLAGIYLFVGSVTLCISLIAVTLPTTMRILGLNTGYCGGTQYSARASLSDFHPIDLLRDLEPNSRVAAEIATYKGHDLRLANHKLLGSGARAIVVDRAFGNNLEKRGLVAIDQVPYGYFFTRPWKTRDLSEYGIRYLVIHQDRDGELEGLGWNRVAAKGGFSVYENPEKPTPVYFRSRDSGKPTFLRTFVIKGNSIKVKFGSQDNPGNLVFAMTHRREFDALVDGEPVAIRPNDNGLLEIEVPANASYVELFHRPYSPALFVMIFLLSGFILWFGKVLVAGCQTEIRVSGHAGKRI
ncbi:MAG: hypothetical protein VYA17_14725 [Pseudomonadota bacterium]|nr:hypothetical protein [Pseudomonadota bacterium]